MVWWPTDPTVGPKDEPCREGKHVSYDSPEWQQMKADAAALVPKETAVDPCDEVERNLLEMRQEDKLAAHLERVRKTIEQNRAS